MSSSSSSFAIVHIVRHGEALHNVQRGYPHRDPPLTEAGVRATKEIKLPSHPDLIVVSPMTRTIQTAINMFPDLQQVSGSQVPVQIWPDLREANDAICNLGLARNKLQSKFPHFDFLECHENWDYPLHTIVDATARAERVRKRLQHLSATFKNIVVISHRGLIAYLVKGRRFSSAESRSYRFATDIEAQNENVRWGVHCDLLQDQDFGPTVLLLHNASLLSASSNAIVTTEALEVP
jgi:broad specificity phosphatase PhoE